MRWVARLRVPYQSYAGTALVFPLLVSSKKRGLFPQFGGISSHTGMCF